MCISPFCTVERVHKTEVLIALYFSLNSLNKMIYFYKHRTESHEIKNAVFVYSQLESVIDTSLVHSVCLVLVNARLQMALLHVFSSVICDNIRALESRLS